MRLRRFALWFFVVSIVLVTIVDFPARKVGAGLEIRREILIRNYGDPGLTKWFLLKDVERALNEMIRDLLDAGCSKHLSPNLLLIDNKTLIITIACLEYSLDKQASGGRQVTPEEKGL